MVLSIPNHSAEQQMQRIALLRKNARFAAAPRGGQTVTILSSSTSTRQRHSIDPQTYLTQLLTGLQSTPASHLDEWLPDRRKKAQSTATATPPPPIR